MTSKFRREWRTIDPYDSGSVARQYGNRAEARDDTDRFPHRVVQQRLVSDWEADQPSPTPPTLADMTEEERADAVGMRADVDGFHPYRAVIGDIPAPKVPVFRPTTGALDWVHPEDVTPLPELGRAWSPGGSPTGTPAPALPDGWRLADHPDHGRVIVTRPAPDRNGNVPFVLPYDDSPLRYTWHFCFPDALTYIDGPGSPDPAPVPPNILAVGSEWDGPDALAQACRASGRDQIVVTDKDGDAFIWGYEADRWENGTLLPEFAPFTILHTGKEDVQ